MDLETALAHLKQSNEEVARLTHALVAAQARADRAEARIQSLVEHLQEHGVYL